MEPDPQRFFAVLYGCGALARLFPEIEPLYLTQEPPPHRRSDGNLPVLEAATALSDKATVRFAALLCDLDRDHEPDSAREPLKSLCSRLPVPNAFREIADAVLRHRERVHRAMDLDAAALLDLLGALDALRRHERLDDLLRVCQADARAHSPAGDYPPGGLLRRAQVVTLAVKADKIGGTIKTGREIGARIRQLRLAALEELLATR